MPWYNVVPYLKAIHHGSKSNSQRRKSHDAKASCSSKRGAKGGNLGNQHIIPANTIKNVVEMPKNQPVTLQLYALCKGRSGGRKKTAQSYSKRIGARVRNKLVAACLTHTGGKSPCACLQCTNSFSIAVHKLFSIMG
jgi:hypothetical protein